MLNMLYTRSLIGISGYRIGTIVWYYPTMKTTKAHEQERLPRSDAQSAPSLEGKVETASAIDARAIILLDANVLIYAFDTGAHANIMSWDLAKADRGLFTPTSPRSVSRCVGHAACLSSVRQDRGWHATLWPKGPGSQLSSTHTQRNTVNEPLDASCATCYVSY